MSKQLISIKDTRISELDFSVDGFHEQKVFRGIDAYGQMLKRLILMRKGTYPSMPDCGVDLASYRFSDIDELVGGRLRDAIQEQVSQYLPSAPIKSISVSKTKYKGDFVLFVTIKLVSNDQIIAGFVERKGSIITSQVSVKTEKHINTQGSED